MVYIKKGAMVLLVNEDQVPKHLSNGFAVFEPADQKTIDKKSSGKAPIGQKVGAENGKDPD